MGNQLILNPFNQSGQTSKLKEKTQEEKREGEEGGFSLLPNELIESIFFFLPPKDLLKIEFSCRRFYHIARRNALWSRFYS